MNSQSEEIKIIRTSNLLEVAFLLDRNHKVTSVECRGGVYGIPELFVYLEGVMIDLDHKSFLTSGGVYTTLVALDGLLEALDDIGEAVSERLATDRTATGRESLERTVSS